MNQLGFAMKVLLVISSLNLASCSVGMAMHGKEDVNLSSITVGQDRSIVVMNLGQPQKTNANEHGRVDTYLVERGNAPSIGRAVGHAAMDVLTLGAWEIIGTPIEGFAGEEFTLTIEYGADDKLKTVVTGSGKSAIGSMK
jgi:hypothetical protein